MWYTWCPTCKISNTWLQHFEFSNIQNQMAVPFAIYADFECFLGKSDIDAGNSTKFCDTHTPSGFCCLTVSSFAEYNNERPYVCSDGNVMDKFFMHLKSEQVRINQILSKNEPMEILNKLQIETYTNCKKCPSCECDLITRKQGQTPLPCNRPIHFCTLYKLQFAIQIQETQHWKE